MDKTLSLFGLVFGRGWLRPTMNKKLGGIFLGFILLGLCNMIVMENQLRQVNNYILTIRVANQLQTVAQKISFISHQVPLVSLKNNSEIIILTYSFEEAVHALEHGSRTYEWHTTAAPQEAQIFIGKVRTDWNDYHQALNDFYQLPADSLSITTFSENLAEKSEQLLESTELLHQVLTTASEMKEKQITFLLYGILGLDILLFAFAIWAVSRRFVLPLIQLSTAVQRLALGDQSVQINFRSFDEIGQLTSGFNKMVKMVDQITKKEKELDKIYKAVESTIDAIEITDIQGKAVFHNESFKQTIGYSVEELNQKGGIKAIFSDPDQSELIHKTVLSGQPWSGEVFIITKTKGQIPMLLRANAVINQDGQVLALVGVYTDITERKQLDYLKDEFVSTVSHELKTPLYIIDAAINNLIQGVAGPLTEKQSDIINRVNRNITRLNKIVINLLEISRLESGKAKITRKQINLHAIILEVVQNFKTITQNKKIDLIYNTPTTEVPRVFADEDMMIQVLNNLISNAMRFAKEKIIIQISTDPQYVTVHISDDGPGIEEENKELIFSKFAQIRRKASLGGTYKGTGLGLPICKKIIELNEGKIGVESQIGQGTHFYFSLPISK